MSGSSQAFCESVDDELMIGNRWLRRGFCLRDGFFTKRFEIRPWGQGAWLAAFAFQEAYPLDAQVLLSEADEEPHVLRVGPWKHEHFGHESDWECVRHEIMRTEVGVRLDVRLRPRGSSRDVELVLCHEVADEAPYLKRWGVLTNTGDTNLIVRGMIVEVLPQLRVGRQIHVIDAYVSPRVTASEDFVGWDFHEFDRGPDVSLVEGDSFESFAVYTLPYADGAEERLSAVNAMLRVAAPWAARPILRHQFGRVTHWKETVDLARRSEALGFEEMTSFVDVHFRTTGDFELNRTAFPNGEVDFKRMVDEIHALGLKYVAYVGFCIANEWSKTHKEHPEWQFVGPEGRHYSPGGIGNMCLMSGWGDFFLDRCRWMTDVIGVDGLQTDGPYYGQPCHATDHAHSTPGEAQYRNWRFEMDFYGEMRDKGKIVQTPTKLYALFYGATCLPQGYHEENAQTLGLFDLVTAFRSRLYTGQMRGLPGWAAWGFAMVDEYHGHGLYPPEEHLHEFEHMIAGHIALGLSGFFHGWDLTSGPNSERVLQKWLGLFRRFRDTLGGDAVFIEAPSGHRPDAVMHVRPNTDVPAVLVGFNPTPKALSVEWSLPLWRADLSGEVRVLSDRDVEPGTVLALDDVGHLSLSAGFEPYEVRWWTCSPSIRA
jgi:hypothetical protein